MKRTEIIVAGVILVLVIAYFAFRGKKSKSSLADLNESIKYDGYFGNTGILFR